MTKKARTGKLYSEVEGEILMENAPDDTMTKENEENEEKMTEIEDIRASHDVDAIMTDDNDEEIVFEMERGTNRSTGSDSKDTSSSLSSSDPPSSSDNESEAPSEVSSEVVCTKVVQGEEYKKPDDWSSDDDATDVQLKVAAPKATNETIADDKQDEKPDDFSESEEDIPFKSPAKFNRAEDKEANPDDEGFIPVKTKTIKTNNHKKINNKQNNQGFKQYEAEGKHIEDKKPKKRQNQESTEDSGQSGGRRNANDKRTHQGDLSQTQQTCQEERRRGR
jgi:hypothetical protein